MFTVTLVLDTFYFVLLKKLRSKVCGKRNIAGAEMATICVLPEHSCHPRQGGRELGRETKTPREEQP